MKKNENIFIALQIQKDQESKGLLLSVQFDKTAFNFSIENEAITWSPTYDEIEFIIEAFALIGGSKSDRKYIPDESQVSKSPSDTIAMGTSHRASEIRIAPLPDDNVLESTTDPESLHIMKNESEEKIFIQADDKKIDEIIKRKKQGIDEEYVIESGEKTLIDRMMKQKKKKE